MSNVYEKLNSIQCKLIAKKGQYNDFGKYAYRSAEDILESVKPHLEREKCILVMNDEIVEISGRHYVKATATIIDSEGNAVSATGFAREEETKRGMDASQITGSASSYARKYSLNGLFAIDDCKDADTNEQRAQINSAEEKQEKPKQEKKTPESKKEKPKAEKPLTDLDGIFCADCGNLIKDFEMNGNRYTAAQLIQTSKKRHGRQQCIECYNKGNK